MTLSTIKTPLAALVAGAFLVGCGSSSSDDGGNNGGNEPQYDVTVADASSGAQVGFDLLSGSTVEIDDASRAAGDPWQVSYQKYVGFATNGGVSGDGTVEGCVAHTYDALYDDNGDPVADEFAKLTAASTEADFIAVTAEACSDFAPDALKTVIKEEEWLALVDYDMATHTATYGAVEGNGFIIMHADGESYSRVKVQGQYVSTDPRQLTFAVEAWNGSAWQAAETVAVDFSDATAYLDLDTVSISSADADWDLSVSYANRSHALQTNGGTSGSADAGVGVLLVDSADDVTDPVASQTGDVYQYSQDSSEGVMSGPGNYGALHYAVAGGHLMWPTFTTYLIKDGSEGDERLFKVQVISNYGEDGSAASGNIVYRYEELAMN